MFRTEAYKEAEARTGYKKRYIAQRMGIAYSRYIALCKGRLDWKASEIEAAADVLGLKVRERNSIFFG